MKLKDIVPYCLTYAKKPGNGIYEVKYYWIVNGLTYTIDSLQAYSAADFLEHNYDPYHKIDHTRYDSFINLSRYNFVNPNETQKQYDPKDNYLVLNLDNEITIHDKFIMVHKTLTETTEDEANLFFKTHYFISNGHDVSAQMYNIGLFHTDPILGGMATNLRTLFKDLIAPACPT